MFSLARQGRGRDDGEGWKKVERGGDQPNGILMRCNGRRLSWDVDMQEGPLCIEALDSVGACDNVDEVVANSVLAIG